MLNVIALAMAKPWVIHRALRWKGAGHLVTCRVFRRPWFWSGHLDELSQVAVPEAISRTSYLTNLGK